MANEENNTIVIGIGASAGGLEALRQLLPALPDQENIAYVIIQHMDPLRRTLESPRKHSLIPFQNDDILISHGIRNSGYLPR